MTYWQHWSTGDLFDLWGNVPLVRIGVFVRPLLKGTTCSCDTMGIFALASHYGVLRFKSASLGTNTTQLRANKLLRSGVSWNPEIVRELMPESGCFKPGTLPPLVAPSSRDPPHVFSGWTEMTQKIIGPRSLSDGLMDSDGSWAEPPGSHSNIPEC